MLRRGHGGLRQRPRTGTKRGVNAPGAQVPNLLLRWATFIPEHTVRKTTHTTRIVFAALACAAVAALWPQEAQAQRRGRPIGRVSAVVVAPPAYFGYRYYDPFWWGGPAWYPSYYGPGWIGTNVASARLQVKPRNAEVYVDGYLAGNVDDFDGFFQRLDVPPGEHEIAIYLDGYETVTQKMLFRPRATLDVKHELRPLAPGQSSGPRPQASGDAAAPPAGRRGRTVTGAGETPPASSFGTLALRVQPSDATVFVDGEEWTRPDANGPVLIELAEGTHEVEVRKEGLDTFRRRVEVRSGRTVTLNVSLPR